MEQLVASVIVPGLSLATLAITLLLRRVLHEVTAIERDVDVRRRDASGQKMIPTHAPRILPPFDAALLGGQGRLTRSDVIPPVGERSSLVFVKPSAFAVDERWRLNGIFTRLAADTPGRLYVVCMDSNEACLTLSPDLLLSPNNTLPCVVDSDGALSRLFQINGRVLGMTIASDGRITRYGTAISRNASRDEVRAAFGGHASA